MSENKDVEIRIIGSPKEYESRDLRDQSLVADAIRNHVLPASKEEYLRVDVKIKREDDTPGYLVAYMLRKDIYLAEVVRVDVDSKLNVKGVEFNYVDTDIDTRAGKETKEGKDYGEFDFVVGSPVPDFPTAKEAVDFLFDLFTKAGFRCRKVLGPDANLANYKMYLASGLKGFVNIGHGNTQSIVLSDGALGYTWFQSLAGKPLKPAVVYFNSCQVFNNPLLPSIMQAGARTFIGGIVNLLVGPSEAVCKCFWSSILKSQIHMADALKQCEQDYPKPGSHGINGDTGPFLSVTPSVYSRIIAKCSNKCLDIPASSTENGAKVQQWPCHGRDNQLFKIEPVYYRIIAKCSNKCLDIPASSTEDGAKVQQWPCHGGDNQLFRIEAVGEYSRIVAKCSNKCLDIPASSTEDGAKVQQWPCHGGDNQLFRIVK